MKKTILTTLAVAVTIAGLGLTTAASAGQNGPKGPRGPHLPEFSQLDANGDGAVTMDEVTAVGAAKFAENDTNGDGFLDASELLAAMQANGPQNGDANRPAPDGSRQGRGFGQMLQRLDTDQDGQISKAEAVGPVVAQFDKTDTDGNGFLSQDELKAAQAARGDKRPNAGTPEERIAKMIEHNDTDGNGMLSPDEAAPDNVGNIFIKMDADGNGSVTKAEWDAAIAAHRPGNAPDAAPSGN